MYTTLTNSISYSFSTLLIPPSPLLDLRYNTLPIIFALSSESFSFSFCTLSLSFLLRVVSPLSLALFLTNLFPFCFPHVSLFPWLSLLYSSRISPTVPLHVDLLYAPRSKLQVYTTAHCHHLHPSFDFSPGPNFLIIIFLCLSVQIYDNITMDSH